MPASSESDVVVKAKPEGSIRKRGPRQAGIELTNKDSGGTRLDNGEIEGQKSW